MTSIFWNTNNISTFTEIESLLTHYSPDLLFLSEISDELIENNKNNLTKLGFEHFENPGCERVI